MPNQPTRQLVAKPSVAAITEYFQPPIARIPSPPQPVPHKEVVALATACFSAVDPRVYDTHRMLAGQMCIDYGSNLWMIPIQERMPFPDACIYSIACMMNTERQIGRKANWFFWLEDDVCVEKDAFRKLRAVAHPEQRPFVAAIGYDRNPPFPPAVWDKEGDSLRQWTPDDVPAEGVHKVGATGLVCAIIHRTLFDKIDEPYFAAGSPVLSFGGPTTEVIRGIKPDAWWSCRLAEKGIPTYVHAGVMTTHLGARLPVNVETAVELRNIEAFSRANYERTFRGRHQKRDSSAVPAGVRQGGPPSVAGGHDGGNGVGAPVPAGEPGGVGVSQATPAARPELPGAVSVDESPGLWRDWDPFGEQPAAGLDAVGRG